MKGNVIFYRGAGKLGNTVGYVSVGKQCFRAYTDKIMNPKSYAQQLQRAKFRVMLEASRLFRAAYFLGMKDEGKSNKRTAFSQFMSVNAGNITGLTPETIAPKYQDLVCALGNLAGVELDSDHIDITSVPGTLSVAVLDRMEGGGNANGDDSCYLVCVCPEKHGGVCVKGAKRREATELAAELPIHWNGSKVYVYTFCVGNGDIMPGQSSRSVYVGNVDFVIE